MQEPIATVLSAPPSTQLIARIRKQLECEAQQHALVVHRAAAAHCFVGRCSRFSPVLPALVNVCAWCWEIYGLALVLCSMGSGWSRCFSLKGGWGTEACQYVESWSKGLRGKKMLGEEIHSVWSVGHERFKRRIEVDGVEARVMLACLCNWVGAVKIRECNKVFCPLRPASPSPKLVARVVGLFAEAVWTNGSVVVSVGLVLSVSILPRANLIYDSDITTKKQVKCRSVHFSSTCKKNAAAQWRLRMTHAFGSKSLGCRHRAMALVNKKNMKHHEKSEIWGLLPLFDRWISAMFYGGNIPLK